MTNRQRKSVIDWLLEEENPSVRYFTLTDILGGLKSDHEVQEAKAKIMQIGIVPRLLAKQKKGGYWSKPEEFYVLSKYKGTIWTFNLLAELGADGKDRRIRKAFEYILKYSQDRQSGGFSYAGNKKGGGYHSQVIPCYSANMVWSMIRFGYLDDPRVQRGIEWITTYQRFDDGVKAVPQGWPYDSAEPCWGKHTCHMGVVKALKALAAIPLSKRSKTVKKTIETGAEFLLKHHIYKRSHALKRISKPSWLKFGFPLFWKTDILEILEILTALGCKDKRMEEAIDLVLSKQDKKGRWKLEKTFNGRMLVSIEREGNPSKWVTLNVLRVLKRKT